MTIADGSICPQVCYPEPGKKKKSSS